MALAVVVILAVLAMVVRLFLDTSVTFASFVVMVMRDPVNLPNRLIRGQDKPVDHGPSWRKDPDGLERSVIVPLLTFLIELQAMTSNESLTEPSAGLRRHASAQHRLKGRIETDPFGHFGIIEIGKTLIGSDNPVTPEIVTKRQRHCARNRRIAAQQVKTRKRDIARGLINVKNARQYELERGTLGTDDQIHTACVTLKAFLCLLAELEKKNQHSDRNGQQQHIERGRKRAIAEIGQRKRYHFAIRPFSKVNERSKKGCNRTSWVATSSDAPAFSATSIRRCATFSALAASSAEVGSSAISKAGLTTSARAIAAR